jgi:hypothetical protein
MVVWLDEIEQAVGKRPNENSWYDLVYKRTISARRGIP